MGEMRDVKGGWYLPGVAKPTFSLTFSLSTMSARIE